MRNEHDSFPEEDMISVATYTKGDLRSVLDSIYAESHPDGVPQGYLDRATALMRKSFEHSQYWQVVEEFLRYRARDVEAP